MPSCEESRLMKNSRIFSLVGIAAVMLVIGTALGSVVFPMIKLETTTTTMLLRNSTSHQLPTVKETVTTYSTIFPNASGTITERIDVTYIARVKAYTSGTCSWVDAVITRESSSNSTEYIFPAINTNATRHEFLNFTVTTTTSTLLGISSTSTDTTITFNETQIANSTSTSAGCPTVV